VQRASAVAVLVASLALLPSCGASPTEFSPLARSLGVVRGMLIQFEGLASLPGDGSTYEAWALLRNNQTTSIGRFQIDGAGNVIGPDGNPTNSFTSSDETLQEAVAVLVTIEQPGDDDSVPSLNQILQGPIFEGVARLTVPASPTLTSATGTYRIFTPTDGPGTNETSGAWALAQDGSPGLVLPTTTATFFYEAFVEIDGNAVSLGRFQVANEADGANPYSGDGDAPAVPGEDLLQNAPSPLTFPLDLSGARLIVSLEARGNDPLGPSQLVILETVLPPGLVGGESVSLTNRASELPSGQAVFY
jgi:hypothetical protein